jgi:hypothetical protein
LSDATRKFFLCQKKRAPKWVASSASSASSEEEEKNTKRLPNRYKLLHSGKGLCISSSVKPIYEGR